MFIKISLNNYHSRYDILKFYINKYIYYLYDAVYENDINYINDLKNNLKILIYEINNKLFFFNEDNITKFKYENLKHNLKLFFETYDFSFLIKN